MEHSEGDVTRRKLDTNAEEPATEIVSALAEIEGRDPTTLEDMWGCTGDVLENIFSNPPSPEADMRIVFNFEGYRITIQQDGHARFRKTG